MFAALNPIQFVTGNKAQPAKYNTKYFDAGWNYSATIKPYEDGKDFTQPVRFGDVISLQVLIAPINIDAAILLAHPTPEAIASVITNPVLTLLDCHNNAITSEMASIAPTQAHIIQGYEFGANTEDAAVFQFNFNLAAFFDSVTGLKGNYRLKIRANFDDGESPTYEDHYSEWLNVREAHPGTVLIEYNNTINDFDTYFEQLHTRFAHRLEGDVHSFEPGAVVTGYANQKEVFTQLSSVPFKNYTFTATSVPDYELDKLNHIFSCDKLLIDGKLFSREDGAKWEVQRVETHPLKGISVKLRAGENSHAIESVSKRTYFEWDGYDTPKFYHRPQLNNFIGQLIILREDMIIEDEADGIAKAATLTSEASTYFLEGTFGFDGRLYYDNADNENYYAGLDKIMSGLMNVHITTPNSNIPFFFTSKGGYLGIDWGDSSDLDFYTPPPGSFSPQHTFATADDYVIRVFHDGRASATTILSFQQQQIVPPTRMITNITGLAPDSLQVFSLTYADLDSSFNLAFLQKTWANLKQLIVEDCNMVHPFTGSLFTYGTAPKWAQLKLLDFRHNQLSSTGVDTVFVEFTSGAYYGFILGAGNGRFKIEGQSPSAPPTITSSPNRAALNSQSWALTTD